MVRNLVYAHSHVYEALATCLPWSVIVALRVLGMPWLFWVLAQPNCSNVVGLAVVCVRAQCLRISLVAGKGPRTHLLRLLLLLLLFVYREGSWAGITINPHHPSSLAVGRCFAKSVTLYDGTSAVRTLHAVLPPHSLMFLPSNAGGQGKQLLSVTEGHMVSREGLQGSAMNRSSWTCTHTNSWGRLALGDHPLSPSIGGCTLANVGQVGTGSALKQTQVN